MQKFQRISTETSKNLNRKFKKSKFFETHLNFFKNSKTFLFFLSQLPHLARKFHLKNLPLKVCRRKMRGSKMNHLTVLSLNHHATLKNFSSTLVSFTSRKLWRNSWLRPSRNSSTGDNLRIF